ncbi:MAG: hypothetical protein LUD16_00510, partial [Lachnospiraceae bacterium]|nr:hypothetical protein [Lachnospiraceae bacterium]
MIIIFGIGAAMMLLTTPTAVSFASDASDVIIADDDIVEAELSAAETLETITEEFGEDVPMVVVEEVEETTEPETTVETETETSLIQLAAPTNLTWGSIQDKTGIACWDIV